MPRPRITKARPYTPAHGALTGRTFTSERQYRNALARRKGFASWDAQRRAQRAVHTRAAYQRLHAVERDARQRALEALAKMRRDKVSLTYAAHLAQTTPEAVLRYARSGLKRAKGRYVATAADGLYRPMRFLTSRGQITLEVTNSRTATRIAKYFEAVDHYLKTGDTRALRKYRGKSIRVGKVAYPFLTDPTVLDRLGRAGEVSFEDLYAQVA